MDKQPIIEEDVYDYVYNLNLRDDGDELSDPSMNDFLKGYKMRPYDFVQWAKAHNKIVKKAATEVVPMHFYPQYLADYILTLWNGADGTLQDFFNAFTLRYNNKLKQAVAKHINEMGFEVYPVLTDDRAFFAKKVKDQFLRVAMADLDTKLLYVKKTFKDSEALRLFLGELDDIKEMGHPVTAGKVVDLLDYYSNIFPDDYAVQLTKNLVVDKGLKDVGFDYYKDFGMTNESLEQAEKILSESEDSYYDIHNGVPYGWDYISDMRGFDGVRPEQFEMIQNTNNTGAHLYNIASKKKD